MKAFKFKYVVKRAELRTIFFKTSQFDNIDPCVVSDYIACVLTQLKKAVGCDVRLDYRLDDWAQDKINHYNAANQKTLDNATIHQALLSHFTNTTFHIIEEFESVVRILTWFWSKRKLGEI